MREGGFASARQTHFWATPPTEEGYPPNIPSAGTRPNGRNYPDANWEHDMMRPYMVAMVVLVAFSSSTSPARSDQYPVLNVAPLCHGLTDRSNLQLGLRDVSFDECMKAEHADRESIIKEWSTFSADDKRHCIAEATMGGESSYTDLLTCLEMARDVRKLHEDQKGSGSSSASAQQGPSAPVGHRQPRPPAQ